MCLVCAGSFMCSKASCCPVFVNVVTERAGKGGMKVCYLRCWLSALQKFLLSCVLVPQKFLLSCVLVSQKFLLSCVLVPQKFLLSCACY